MSVLHTHDAGVIRETILELADAMRGGLLLLEAPAGFGKTYALAQACDLALLAKHTVAWLGLNGADRSIASLSGRIVDALLDAGVKALPGNLAAAVAADVDAATWVAKVTRGIVAHARRVLLVLDDYQTIEGSPADQLLIQLFEQLPANLLIGLASRRVCPILPSRLLLQGRVHRVAARSLLFSKAEARAFFDGSVSAAQLNSLHALTEGWPAALKMAQLSLAQWHRRDAEITSVASFNRLIADYSIKEVLSSVDGESLALLADCAISESLHPALCDAITARSNSSHILASLAAHETFMEADDREPGTWHVPRLLRATLSTNRLATNGLATRGVALRGAERTSDCVAERHVRAARYFESVGNTRSALQHYIDANKPALAAAALERSAPFARITALGETGGRELLDLIPRSQIQSFPRLALLDAFLANKRGMQDEAQVMLADLASRTENFSRDRPGGNDALLKAEAFCLDLLVKLYAHSHAERDYLRTVEEQLASIGKHDPRLVTFPHIALGVLYECRGDLQAAESHFIQCQKIVAADGAPWMTMWFRFHGGTMALARGELMEARYQLQTAAKLARSEGVSPTLRAITKLHLAEIDYERNALPEAQIKLGEGLYSAEHVEGWFGPYAALYETAMMLHWHAGRIDEIEPLLARGFALDRIRPVLGRFLKVLQLRFELLEHRLDSAQASIANERFDALWAADSFQDTLGHREWDLLGVCLCHLAIHRGELARALPLIDRMERVARVSGRSRTVVRALTLRAIVASRSLNDAEAVSHMVRALDLAQPLGYCRVFLDQGDLIQPVLAAVARGERASVPAHIASFARTLG